MSVCSADKTLAVSNHALYQVLLSVSLGNISAGNRKLRKMKSVEPNPPCESDVIAGATVSGSQTSSHHDEETNWDV